MESANRQTDAARVVKPSIGGGARLEIGLPNHQIGLQNGALLIKRTRVPENPVVAAVTDIQITLGIDDQGTWKGESFTQADRGRLTRTLRNGRILILLANNEIRWCTFQG